MKRTLLVVTLIAVAIGGCAKSFPGMSRHATSPKPSPAAIHPTARSPAKQPATHLATKAASPATSQFRSAPATTPAKTTVSHKS